MKWVGNNRVAGEMEVEDSVECGNPQACPHCKKNPRGNTGDGGGWFEGFHLNICCERPSVSIRVRLSFSSPYHPSLLSFLGALTSSSYCSGTKDGQRALSLYISFHFSLSVHSALTLITIPSTQKKLLLTSPTQMSMSHTCIHTHTHVHTHIIF